MGNKTVTSTPGELSQSSATRPIRLMDSHHEWFVPLRRRGMQSDLGTLIAFRPLKAYRATLAEPIHNLASSCKPNAMLTNSLQQFHIELSPKSFG